MTTNIDLADPRPRRRRGQPPEGRQVVTADPVADPSPLPDDRARSTSRTGPRRVGGHPCTGTACVPGFTLRVEYEQGGRELYDLAADPGELDNATATRHAEVQRGAGPPARRAPRLLGRHLSGTGGRPAV